MITAVIVKGTGILEGLLFPGPSSRKNGREGPIFLVRNPGQLGRSRTGPFNDLYFTETSSAAGNHGLV